MHTRSRPADDYRRLHRDSSSSSRQYARCFNPGQHGNCLQSTLRLNSDLGDDREPAARARPHGPVVFFTCQVRACKGRRSPSTQSVGSFADKWEKPTPSEPTLSFLRLSKSEITLPLSGWYVNACISGCPPWPHPTPPRRRDELLRANMHTLSVTSYANPVGWRFPRLESRKADRTTTTKARG